ESSADPGIGGAPDQQPGPPISLEADMARIIEEQADVIAQKQLYHSQLMLGVAALGTDIVSAKQSTMMVASALRSGNTPIATDALVKLGDAQFAQVNDRTLPYRFNSQISGLLQGIILDAISQAYSSQPDKITEAQLMLSKLFASANVEAMRLPKEPPRFQAPAFSPEPLRLAAGEAVEQPK
ncbi:MAG: hypothetical protein ABIO92_02635, partial [Chloroflexia bacterium]